MTSRFLPLLAIWFLVLNPAAAHAANWCRPDRAPQIYVGLQAPTPKSNFTLSMAQLETFKIDTESPYGAHIDTHVGGLTSGGIKIEQEMQLGGVTLGDQACVWVTQVQVIIRLEQTVYVAREYPPGTCMNKSIWDHEHKHVRVDREVINQYRPYFEAAVNRAVRERYMVGPVGSHQVDRAQKILQTHIQTAIKGMTERMQTDRERRQQAVDSLDEYERVSRSCS